MVSRSLTAATGTIEAALLLRTGRRNKWVRRVRRSSAWRLIPPTCSITGPLVIRVPAAFSNRELVSPPSNRLFDRCQIENPRLYSTDVKLRTVGDERQWSHRIKTKDLSSDDVAIGKKLRACWLIREMSLSDLARELGISPQQVHNYEKGLNCTPGSRLRALAKVLDRRLS